MACFFALNLRPSQGSITLISFRIFVSITLSKVIHHIEGLAKQLYDNENVNVPNGQNYSQRIPLPTDGHMSRVHQPVFPTLDPNLVSRIIEENHQNNVNSNNVHFSSSSQNKLVPLGQRLPGKK